MYVHGYSSSSSGGGGGMAGLPGKTTTPVTAEEMAQIKELKLAHFCNLAMCHMKHGPNLQKARQNCSKALEIDPNNVKALFRRGKCHAQLNALDEAKEDLERVLELQPDNKEAVRELRGLKAAFASLRKKEQRKFAGMFDKLQADAEAEAEAEAAGAGPANQPGGGRTGAGSSAASASAAQPPPMVDPAKSSAGADSAMNDDEDIGEPLGEPQTFEPRDVHIGNATGGA
jgi:Tfp pilus assembly protein PilF